MNAIFHSILWNLVRVGLVDCCIESCSCFERFALLHTLNSFSAGKLRFRSRLQGIPLVLAATTPDHQALLSRTPDVTLYNHLRAHSPWSWGLHVPCLCTAVWGSCQSLCFSALRITTPFVEFALPFVGNSKRCPTQRLVDWRAPTSVAVLVCV